MGDRFDVQWPDMVVLLIQALKILVEDVEVFEVFTKKEELHLAEEEVVEEPTTVHAPAQEIVVVEEVEADHAHHQDTIDGPHQDHHSSTNEEDPSPDLHFEHQIDHLIIEEEPLLLIDEADLEVVNQNAIHFL